MQEYLTRMPRLGKEVEKTWQMWHQRGEECPTIKIHVRWDLGDSNASYKKNQPNANDLTGRATSGYNVCELLIIILWYMYFFYLFTQAIFDEKHLKQISSHIQIHYYRNMGLSQRLYIKEKYNIQAEKFDIPRSMVLLLWVYDIQIHK